MKKAIFVFSILALVAFTAGPALAKDHNDDHGSNNDSRNTTTVSNSSRAFVGNVVVSEADTGDNTAYGSYAGDGGDSGDIRSRGGEVDKSGTGMGGRGGNSGIGGGIYTGAASSEAGVLNIVNSNATDIETCGCERDGDTTTTVRNNNQAMVLNGVFSEAETGDNTAYGSYAGDGGDSGDIYSSGSSRHYRSWGHHNEGHHRDSQNGVDDSGTGAGGAGGSSSAGGYVQTGSANSGAGVVNVVNTNLTRIR